MYPYDYQYQGEHHQRYMEEYPPNHQNYTEEHRQHYPQYQHPQYPDSAGYDPGYPPSNYGSMPPQFGPPGHLPMRPPEPYAGSFYPSAYPPVYQDAYPPVSSIGPFTPPAYPPMYPPRQEYATPSGSVSYLPTREETYPAVTERQSSFHNLLRSYSSSQEEFQPSAPELPSLQSAPLSSTPEVIHTSPVKPQPAYSAPAVLSEVECPKGELVRVFSKANKSLNLAAQGDTIVMATANIQDDAQLWIKDGRCGVRIKDRSGQPAFILVNKASKKVLKHGSNRERPVQLVDYSADIEDEDVLWTESQDLGEGFKTVRMVGDTNLNMTVQHGSSIVLDTWQKKDFQLWKLFPL